MEYPLVNGHRYSYASIEATLGSKKYVGFKEISYDSSNEPGVFRGTASQDLGTTRGKYGAKGSVTLGKEEFQELAKALGAGFMQKRFPIQVVYADEGAPTITDNLEACRITAVGNAHAEGSDALYVKLDLYIGFVQYGGLDPVTRIDASGATF